MMDANTSIACALTVSGPPRWVSPGEPAEAAGEPAVLLTMDVRGRVSVYSGKVEYGQAIRHGFALAVADELTVAPGDVEVVLADTARVPWDRGTVGSASTRTTGIQLRRAAVTARRELTRLAADRLGVGHSDIVLENGSFRSASSGETLEFGDLVEGVSLEVDVAEDVPATWPDQADLNGTRGQRIDAVEKVTGRAEYVQDLVVPGMLHGRIVRPATYGSMLIDFDDGRASRVPGFVTSVRDGNFAGVVAETEYAADEARDSIRARWEETRDDTSDWSLPSLLKQQAGDAVELQESGILEDGIRSASDVIESAYFVPYVANSQMEPSAAVASWDGDYLTVWCASRGPFAERTQLASSLDIDEEHIRVISQTVGGSFGTKSPTVSLEAALLAKASGRPVKVAYSRSEEFAWSTVRPAALIEIKSGHTPDGKLTVWDYRGIHAGENAFRGRRGAPTPYDVPHKRVSVAGSASPLQYGSYRSLGGAVNHFAREVHMDKIARRLEIDPAEMRLRNLSQARYIRVLNAATEKFGWRDRNRRAGTGYGLAVGFDAGSYVAQCVEVEINRGQVQVKRMTAAFDCGAIVNQDGVKNQVEGSIMMGIGTALWEIVEFDAGRVLTTGFNKYRVPRAMDTPDIEVVLIQDSTHPSTGAGEPGIVPVAAAIASAVTDATGIEIEQLPIELQLR